MKVRIIVSSLYIEGQGGAETYFRGLIVNLVKAGHSVKSVAISRGESVLDENWFRFNEVGFNKIPIVWRLNPLFRVVWYLQMAFFKSYSFRPDVIIGGPDPISVGLLLKFPGARFINVPHALISPLEVCGYDWSSLVQKKIAVAVSRYIEVFCLRRAELTVRFTAFSLAKLVEFYGPKLSENAKILQQPIFIRKIVPARRANKKIRLLFVGRLVKSKNLAFAISTLSMLIEFDWEFVVVGAGPDEAELRALSDSLGLSSRIKFLGFQDRMDEIYVNADLLLFPSKLENAPLVVLEAAVHAIPAVVISNQGLGYINPFSEWLVDNRGFVARSEVDFLNILRSLLESPDIIKHSGLLARDWVIADHSWEQHLLRLQLAEDL